MITFKRFQAFERLSQETTAFAADVYWKGRLIGHATNEGCGAMALFRPSANANQAQIAEAQDFVKLQKIEGGEEYGLKNFEHLEDYLDDMANRNAEQTKHLNRMTRLLKKSTVYMVAGVIYTLNKPYAGNEEPIKAYLAKEEPEAVILNALPRSEANTHFMAMLRTK